MWPWSSDKNAPLPDRILAVWTDSVLHQQSQTGIRGFGGRVYFYSKDNPDPIEVDGSLVVYAFDANDLSPNTQQPLRKFVFTPEQFRSHMSKTSMGPSYSVWLPWSEVGGPAMRLSLIARFEGKDGGTVLSEPVIKQLPGVPGNNQANKKGSESDKNVLQVSHSEKAWHQGARKDSDSKNEGESSGSDIQTIDVPPSFHRHLRNDSQSDPNADKPRDVPDNQVSVASYEAPAALHRAPSDKQNSQESKSKSEGLEDLPVLDPEPFKTQVFDYRSKSRTRKRAVETENRWDRYMR